MTALFRRIAQLGRRSQFESELDDEIRFHIETRADELIDEGLSPKAAQEQARREFGSRTRATESTRDVWRFGWIEDLWRDLGYALRISTKRPAFTAVAVLSLSLGVGANCAMFIFVDAMLLRPLAVPHSDQLITVRSADSLNSMPLSYAEYLDVRDRAQSFSSLAAFSHVNIGFAQRPGVNPRTKDGLLVTTNYFDLLGIDMHIGRGFLAKEDTVVVLSNSLWEREFHSDNAIVGKQVWLGTTAFTVIGVTPRNFIAFDDDFTDDYPDYYVPLAMAARIGAEADLFERRDIRLLSVMGRLATGYSIQEARSELTALATHLAKQYPDTSADHEIVAQTVRKYRTDGFSGYAGILVMSLAAAVLLVACANVAGLLSGRAVVRSREMATRLALGASRPRVIRQLLAECLLLAAAGGIGGVLLGSIPVLLLKRAILQIAPQYASDLTPLRLDARVVVFTILIALASVLLFGLAPAFQATRVGDRSGRQWGRRLLVAMQVAVSIFLLSVSGFIYSGLQSVLASVSESGFVTGSVRTVTFDPLLAHYGKAQVREFYDRLLTRLRSTPGIAAVTLGSSREESLEVRLEAVNSPTPQILSGSWVNADFFSALAIPIIRGRGFRVTESEVAVVNEAFAEAYWHGQDAVGKRFRIDKPTPHWVQIVGVAAIKQYDDNVSIPAPSLLFLSASDNPKVIPMALYVRLAGTDTSAVSAVRQAVRDLDPAQAVPEIHHWGEKLEVSRSVIRLAGFMVAAIGATGILLALVGLYGLVSYDVNTKTREIGLRMALGAQRGSLLRRFLRQGVVLAACGIAGGLAIDYAVEQILFSFIPNNSHAANSSNTLTWNFGVREEALLTLAVLLLVTLATSIPARRAASVDPNTALRCD